MFGKTQRKADAINKELLDVERREKKLQQAALKATPAAWKTVLEEKIPKQVYAGVEYAFGKGFAVILTQGRAIIEKGFNKDDIKADYAIRDYAVQLKGGQKELRQVQKGAQKSELRNLTVTTLEGIGLGALGIGMPDIVLFVGMILKGVYETALNYGFDYESRQEQMLILKMIETALSNAESWVSANAEVDEMLALEKAEITDENMNHQLKATACAFAMDMLLLKYIQGLPVVGIIGGAANPVYYHKIMRYVSLKYRKRYLWNQLKK